ncbi:unnamed protein product [Clonostachys rosea]|uniref:Chitin synthase export chaperone n=1 Tax=Bionectria ochroleuca TaxID=29856 RepID=A0ABY6UAY4_BIOOC|nr:unnamed protein product [Clonostachys rosea]
MGSTEFGNFNKFCAHSTLPVCNLLSPPTNDQDGGDWGGCKLVGIALEGGRNLTNVGSIILASIAVIVTTLILSSSGRKKFIGRGEMQIFLFGYILISVCEIFSVGGLPISKNVRMAFSAIHIGAITATTWVLVMNALVGFQLTDDSAWITLSATLLVSAILFVGTGYIALDTGFQFTQHWASSYEAPNRHIFLYVLYQLAPLVFLVVFYILEGILVIRVLGEIRPMLYLSIAAVLFAIGQVFNYIASGYICDGTGGKVDGALFQTFFTLLSVIMIWIFWTSLK